MLHIDNLLVRFYAYPLRWLKRRYKRDNFWAAKYCLITAAIAIQPVVLMFHDHIIRVLAAGFTMCMGLFYLLIWTFVRELRSKMPEFHTGGVPQVYGRLVAARLSTLATLPVLLTYELLTKLNGFVVASYLLVISALYAATIVNLNPPKWVGQTGRSAYEALRRLVRPARTIGNAH